MPEASDLTPMIRQYQEIKSRYPDALLLYRIGDFYEMFFEDAVAASKILDIVLTSRNKNDPNPVPLCGVPYHAVQSYIAKLLATGRKVALCDQVEDPKLAKGVVRREVTRVMTPGLNLDMVEPRQSSYLVSVLPLGSLWGFAFLEFTTGDFQTTVMEPHEVHEELATRSFREILLPEGVEAPFSKGLVTTLPGWVFEEGYALRMIQEQWGVVSLAGFGCDGIPAGVAAAGAILHYLRETQKRAQHPHLTSLRRYQRGDQLILSEETRRSLDLDRLIGLIDKTKTAMGGRKLRQWMRYPLTDLAEIRHRHDSVQELLLEFGCVGTIQGHLEKVYDLERLAGRISLKSAGARDLVSLASSLQRVEALGQCFPSFESGLLRELAAHWDPLPEIRDEVERLLVPDPPFNLHEGGLIREGVDPLIDELRQVRTRTQKALAQMEERERSRTGIPSLKIRFNRVFGYYVEVTSAHLGKVPSDYLRKQTLANAERFITPELKEFETKILGADERLRVLEYEAFVRLRDRVAAEIVRLKSQADRTADLDVLTSLAQVARERGYVRPELCDEPILDLEECRHPIVEQSLPPGRFVPNDISLESGRRFWLITGPNMAGKSTFIRQAGLAVIMAQAGGFVAAKRATLGIVDRIFSRIGASDRLAEGQSTFMVEMSETASLLHHATTRSLVLLDEIGRGTSTFDGLSIAWAVAEHLHTEVRARTLFATHYHELIELAVECPAIQNYHVAVCEEQGEVVFLYQLHPGGTSHSYGIHVAKLAGLPRPVVERAYEVLRNLESDGGTKVGKRSRRNEAQITLFK